MCRARSVCATLLLLFFFFQAEDGIRDSSVTGVQTCALPICAIRRETSILPPSNSNPFPVLLHQLRRGAGPSSYFFVANSGRMVSCPAQYFFRSSFFRILPVPVFGRLGRNSTDRGHL